jgi:hypothetical protein
MDNETKWIALVKNDKALTVCFSAIDHNMPIPQQEQRCDGMLIFNGGLYLIELKDQIKRWIPEAKNQLANTIRLIKINNSKNLESIKYKKAYACNKKHPRFEIITASESKSFFENTGFRLDINSCIVVKN